ncbi:hypothetical protein PC116_g25898 [Phytophthora cactorum]|uniref:Uncharacterized protein n=1 Tax=Phytophthora cactorum TaxID=29920 RepID=A0A8T1JUT0_9STRA|nr:hypothetical protein PC112_g20093 [Phytophthora cactorum]KAG2876689.1 hypothetical protein PC114_g24067 [Phytophthora cactorum]KAG2892821.1 hypothetical protein PC117_g23936 [Phytophthora cactorum]KAG4225681.1 hypothetical protein PC116_g25898 [Phytophthora cactorum]
MRGPLSEEDLAKVDRNNATDTMDNLRAEDEKPLFAAVASSFVQAANGISKSVAERASDNTAGLYLPPVLPHQLVKTNVLSFQQMIQSHAPRILVRQSNVEVPQIGQELSQLRRAYAREVLRGALDSLGDEDTSFEEGWKTVGDRFKSPQTILWRSRVHLPQHCHRRERFLYHGLGEIRLS